MFVKLNAIAKTDPNPKEHPTLIILGGSPGVGKSTFIKTQIVDKNFGITGNDYFVISHDNIMENFKPFQDDIRTKLAGIDIRLPKANNANIAANYAKIEPELGSLSGTYVKYFNPHNPHNFNIVRNLIFQEAMRRKYNIIYDTTFTAKKDIIEEHITPYVSPTSSPYSDIHVIHIYATPSTIERHLNARHKAFMKQKNYMRAIPKKMVGFFVGDNKAGFKNAVRGHGGDRRFKFYEYDNTTYDGVLTPVVVAAVESSGSNRNGSANNSSAAKANNNKALTKRRTKPAAVAAAANNSSRSSGANVNNGRNTKTRRGPASKKVINKLGPVSPPKSNNANNGSKTAVAAAAVPETTSGRSRRVVKPVERYGQ